MNTFIVTIQYSKLADNGSYKTVNEQYLVDAMTYTEAEARITQEMQTLDTDFTITSIVKPKIAEIFPLIGVEDSRWYRVKFSTITLDVKTAVEKKTSTTVLVEASDFDNAYNQFIIYLKGSTDYEIASIAETPIVQYIPYNAED